MKIGSVVDFLAATEFGCEQKMYRGQARQEWDLIPSIGRLFDKFENFNVHFEDWGDVEVYLLSRFKNRAAPYMEFTPSSKLEWLIHAQHHGLPTPLLDWSTNPLKALFFAIENPAHDDTNGVVYAIAPRSWYIDTSEIEEIKRLTAFYPKNLNSRVVSQEGCFTAFPYPEKLAPLPVLNEDKNFVSVEIATRIEITISMESKKTLRKELDRLGINHQSMYPGLDGVSKNITQEFYQ